MKRTTLFLIGALLALPAAGGDSETTVTVGGWGASEGDNPDLAAEYRSTDGGAELGVESTTHGEQGSVELALRLRDDNEQQHALDFDIGRFVRSHTSYLAMVHRLGADSLENLAGATRHGRAVWATDLDPGSAYEIDYRDLRHRTELQPPGLANLTVGLNFRQQEREGTLQTLAISHCSSCHVVSQARPLDERTRDVGLDARWAAGKGTIKASYNHRTLSEGIRQISLLFDNALQPELLTPIFDDRLQWDSAEGPQPIDRRPDTTKNVAKLEASFDDVKGFVLGATGLWSQTENDTVGLESSYEGIFLHAARNFGNGIDLRWRGRAYQLEADDVFVVYNERKSIAGAQAGKTYRQVYGFEPNYLRESAIDRDVFASELDVGWRLPRKLGRLRFLWELESIDRGSFEVAAGETQTTENVLGLDWSVRPAKRTRFQLAYRHGFVDNPFLHVDGTYSTLVTTPTTATLSPATPQYYQFQAARVGDATASPEDWDELRARASFGFAGGTTLAASYRLWDGANDSGDLTDWSKTSQAATITLAGLASPQVAWNLAWAWHDQEIDMPVSIPIYDG